MADAVDKAPDSGEISMPRVDSSMNRVGPNLTKPSDERSKDSRLQTGDKKRSGDETAKLLAKIRKRFDRCVRAESDQRKSGLEDDKFYAGDQWPSDVVADRNNDKRPCLTFNKFPTLVHQVTNDQRQNRPAINYSPVGERGDPEGAKMMAALVKAIERDSAADIAYDTAYESAARKGWGYWRIILQYAKPEPGKPTFDQELRLERIPNAFSVYLDPDHKDPTGADARFGFITENMTRSDFDDEYPDAQPISWNMNAGAGDTFKNWVTQDSIRVAEYYEIEYEKREAVMLDNGFVGWEDELPEMHEQIISRREVDCPTVTWYKVTAIEVLDEKPWPGESVPIVKIIGDEINIEGKSVVWGLVRHAKDAQRALNFWKTKEAEAIALVPNAPFIMAEGQDEGYENEWKVANNKPVPTLHYRPLPDGYNGPPLPPPQRQQPAGVPAAFVTAAAGANEDLMSTTGVRFDPSPKEHVYDESGRALRELRRSGDIGTFHLVDNLARSLRRTGELFLELIPKVYERKRIVTILREGDKEERVEIDPNLGKAVGQRPDERTGKTMQIFNPSFGQYGVAVTVGPSYATKRIEAAESMMDFLRAFGQAYPQLAAAIADLVAKNQDWPGGDEITKRLAIMVGKIDPSLIQPDMKDVPPQIQALLSSMQQQVQSLTMEKAALTKQLTDENADRAIQADKIAKDFEAKLLNVVAQFEAKMAAVDQKREASLVSDIGRPLQELAQGVIELREALANPPSSPPN